jgi:hypothetical protein
VRTIRLDKIRGLSKEVGEACRIVESLSCYAMSRIVAVLSGSRRTLNGHPVVVFGFGRRSVGRDNSPIGAPERIESEVEGR